MAKVIMRVAGMDGQIALLSDRIVIRREGLWNALWFGFNSQREIPLSAISEVMFRRATKFRFGVIEFVRSGRSTDEKKSAKNSMVKFTFKQHAQFEAFKEKVFELMEQYNRKRSQ